MIIIGSRVIPLQGDGHRGMIRDENGMYCRFSNVPAKEHII